MSTKTVAPTPPVSASRARREREKAETRRLILEAARELFTSEGYAQTSMRKIADKIGYTATAIYHHFADKDALLNELCLNDFRALGEALRQMDQLPDPMFLVERPIPGPEIVTIDPAEDGYGFLISSVREAIDLDLLRPELTDVEGVAQMIWSGVHGLSAIHLHSQHKPHPWMQLRDPLETAALYTDVVLRGVLRDPK